VLVFESVSQLSWGEEVSAVHVAVAVHVVAVRVPVVVHEMSIIAVPVY
jgi:hypothetical protein